MIDLISINFVLDNKDFAFRSWPSVPRVGEFVTLRPNGEPTTYLVKLVLWNVRENRNLHQPLECDVHITKKAAAISSADKEADA